MIYEVFSVHDIKADAYLPPFILPKIEMAKRIFSDCVNSVDHQFGKNPADYTLFRLGTFNDETGQFLLERANQSLGNGVEFRSPDHPISPELTNGRSNPQENASIESVGDVASIQPSATGTDSPV